MLLLDVKLIAIIRAIECFCSIVFCQVDIFVASACANNWIIKATISILGLLLVVETVKNTISTALLSIGRVSLN